MISVYILFFYFLFFKSVASSCPKLPVIDSNTNKASFENINSELPSSRISTSYDAKGLQAFFNLANSFINTVQPKSLSEEFQGGELAYFYIGFLQQFNCTFF